MARKTSPHLHNYSKQERLDGLNWTFIGVYINSNMDWDIHKLSYREYTDLIKKEPLSGMRFFWAIDDHLRFQCLVNSLWYLLNEYEQD